jgi:hypothetical protein
MAIVRSVSGLLGALLVGALTKCVVPLRTSGWFWAAVLAGIFGGFMFSLALNSSYDPVMFACYVPWVAVCVLNMGATSDTAMAG